MNIKEDFQELTETLKHQRDEIALKVHLAGMDAKGEWEKAEKKWGQFSIKANDIVDDAKETSDELVDGAKVIGEELKLAYTRIKERL
jgi:hypothetical protein